MAVYKAEGPYFDLRPVARCVSIRYRYYNHFSDENSINTAIIDSNCSGGSSVTIMQLLFTKFAIRFLCLKDKVTVK